MKNFFLITPWINTFFNISVLHRISKDTWPRALLYPKGGPKVNLHSTPMSRVSARSNLSKFFQIQNVSKEIKVCKSSQFRKNPKQFKLGNSDFALRFKFPMWHFSTFLKWIINLNAHNFTGIWWRKNIRFSISSSIPEKVITLDKGWHGGL